MEGTIMKLLRQGIALTLVGAGLVAVPALTATAAPSAADDDGALVTRMRATADGTTIVQREQATGAVGFIRARGEGDLLPDSSAAPAAKADAYLDRYADAFGAPRSQLKQADVTRGAHGT